MNTEPRKPSFTFPKANRFTGKIQYRVDDMHSVVTPFGITLRGEVKEVTNRTAADALVSNGDHIHVAADTPVGVPQSVIDEHSPRKKAAPVATETKPNAAKVDGAGAANVDPKPAANTGENVASGDTKPATAV